MQEQRRIYPQEFKIEAVELLLYSGRPAQNLAESLGITANILHRWKREYLASKEKAFLGNGNPQDKELHDLKRR